MIGSNGYYSIENLSGFDKWDYFYRGVIGGRGLGKTVSLQKLVIDKALYKKENFAWIRTNNKAVTNCVKKFPDVVVKNKVRSRIEAKNDLLYINGKVRGHFMALSQAHNIKGSSFDWKSITNIVFDEFNMEPTEKKNFDLVDAFISIVETIARPAERIELYNQGHNIKPCVVWFSGNDTQEASPLLERFNFIPEKPGRFILPNKMLIVEYAEDSEAWKRKRKRSPLHVLRNKWDKQLGESTQQLKINTRPMGELKNPRHQYRVWIGLNEYVDIFFHHDGVWATRQFSSKAILRMHGYQAFVVKPEHLRSGRYYRQEIINSLKLWLWTDKITFDSAMTGRLFIQALGKKQ